MAKLLPVVELMTCDSAGAGGCPTGEVGIGSIGPSCLEDEPAVETREDAASRSIGGSGTASPDEGETTEFDFSTNGMESYADN